MIYFCKGCTAGCKGLEDCCKECTKCCAPCCKVLERPLGGYVLCAFIANLVALLCAGIGGVNEGVSDCSNVQLLCFANVGLALVHTGFALYLQSRLVQGMAKAAPTAQGTSKEIMTQAGHIMLYDVGFCLYLFVFVGSFGLNVVGMSWASACNSGTALPFLGALCMVMFALFVGFFSCFWFCFLACDDCCGGSPQRHQAKPKKNRGVMGFFLGGLLPKQQQQPGPAAQPYGQPAYAGTPAAQPGYAQPVAQPGYAPGQPVAQAQPVYAQPVYAGTPAPPPQPTAAQQAAGVAGAGISMMGKGMAAAGGYLQSKSATPAKK